MKVIDNLFYCTACEHLRPLHAVVMLHKNGYHAISGQYKVQLALCCSCADTVHVNRLPSQSEAGLEQNETLNGTHI